MPMAADDIERLLMDAFPDAIVEIKDLRGDGDHYAVKVESAAFFGQSRVGQHRMVFAALEGRVGSILQALSLQTIVPAQPN
ncbi:MAG: BolA/IbaG family iron-sulfur metabolism protein [Pseudomonadota bacterium]|nr:BolA/IbaG family iron-sulfur metabolism protein [Pseudomonadota bacterium]